jgi:Carboxypeptidase regulatory-like domain
MNASVVLFAVGVLLTVGFAGTRAHAQVIRVPGSVKDNNGRPVRGAVITADNPDQTPPRMTATSNDKGQFGFLGIRRGLWTFTVEAPGFETVRVRRPVTPGARQEPIDVRLTKSSAPVALPLDGIKSDDLQQRIDRAEGLATSGDLDGAIAAWRDLLTRVPALTSIYLRIGSLYERKPDLDRAIEAYQQLLQLEPGNEKARAALGRLQKSGSL